MSSSVEHRFIPSNGIRLHVAESGPTDGKPVILLHGFPELWYGWRHQIPYLARAGYRVWAPDQRGYNLSDKPPGISAYDLDILTQDAIGLIDAMQLETGRDKVSLIGHDWGGVVTWLVAARHADRLDRAVVINAPHPSVMKRMLARSLTQWMKSSYMLFFQLPLLPEASARLGNWLALWTLMLWSSRKGAFTPSDLDVYRMAWSQPGAYTSMLNWYRALPRKFMELPRSMHARLPVLVIWGAGDQFLDRRMGRASIEQCKNGHFALISDATHWVQHEAPRRVNTLIDTFLKH